MNHMTTYDDSGTSAPFVATAELELLPCPSCDKSERIVLQKGLDDPANEHFERRVRCVHCGMSTDFEVDWLPNGAEGKAMEAWGRRVVFSMTNPVIQPTTCGYCQRSEPSPGDFYVGKDPYQEELAGPEKAADLADVRLCPECYQESIYGV